MSGKVTESIFSNKRITIPLADVQHIEKSFYDCDGVEFKKGDLNGASVVTKHTKSNEYGWENAVWLGAEEVADFIKAWCRYRGELEDETLMLVPRSEASK